MGKLLARSKTRNRKVMKTFGLFMLIQVISLIVSAILLKDLKTDEILKFMFSQQLAFIMYKLIKEEYKS